MGQKTYDKSIFGTRPVISDLVIADSLFEKCLCRNHNLCRTFNQIAIMVQGSYRVMKRPSLRHLVTAIRERRNYLKYSSLDGDCAPLGVTGVPDMYDGASLPYM